MNYSVERFEKRPVRIGPPGLFSVERTVTLYSRPLEPGEILQVHASNHEVMADAELKPEGLVVKPHGDVVVDMGSITSLRSVLKVEDEKGEEEFLWPGEIESTGDVTVRREDFSEGVHFRRTDLQHDVIEANGQGIRGSARLAFARFLGG